MEGTAAVVWALEGVVVADVEVDMEPVDDDDTLVDVEEGRAEADEPTRPAAVRLT